MHKNGEKFEMDYSYFKTQVCKRRRPLATRELSKIAYSAPQSAVSLAEGLPNEETFPFTEISAKLYDGSRITLDDRELATALQYISTQGYPPLVQTLRELQRRVHAPPLWESRDIIVVSGAQDGLSKTLEAIIGDGDPILIHDPIYPGVQAVVSPYNAELIPIPQDEDGLIPGILSETLRGRELAGKKMPKVMYINPTGSNPTGVIVPVERRREIYRIACEYNFLIIEDDPYQFMHFDQEDTRSFMSLDTEGRVIRVDSFSKIICSGIRVGFVTAAAPLIASVELHVQSSHLHAPTLSQVILYKLLKTWGHDGLTSHFVRIRRFYKDRRDVIVALAKKHLDGLADFAVPRSGFFLWIKVNGVQDTWKMMMQRGVAEGVIMAPGAAFMVDSSKGCNAVRASFAKASYEEMDLAMKRLAYLIRTELEENYSLTNGNGCS